MKRALWVILCAMLCGMTGCEHVKDYAEIARNQAVSHEYMTVLEAWTREQTVYSHFETTLRVVATYKSPDFRKAYVSEYERIYGTGDTGKDLFPAGGRDNAGADFREFFFYASTPQAKANDFAAPQSVWNVVLREESGIVHRPVEIREIEDINPFIMKLFPYVNRYYGKFYSLKYPLSGQYSESAARGHQTENLSLIFTSVLGGTTLEWYSAIRE